MAITNFKNTPSERFYYFFSRMIANKETSNTDIAHAFNKYKANPPSFLNGIRVGNFSVTVEMILIAQEIFNLDPCTLFEDKTNWNMAQLTSVQEFYDDTYKTNAAAINIGKKMHAILKKHKVNIKEYANRLNMSEQNLYKQLRGDGRIYADTIITICRDYNEPLEQFRIGAMPNSYTIERLRFCEETIRAKNETIEILKTQLEKEKAGKR